jgi:hypothetical protein
MVQDSGERDKMTKQVDDTDGGNAKRAGKPRVVGKGYDAEFRGYINLELSLEEKELFAGWVSSVDAPELLDRVVADGVNLSLKVDPKGSGFLASATQRREDSPNAGLVVTARAGSPGLALWRVVFSLGILYTTGHWEDRQRVADPDRW